MSYVFGAGIPAPQAVQLAMRVALDLATQAADRVPRSAEDTVRQIHERGKTVR